MSALLQDGSLVSSTAAKQNSGMFRMNKKQPAAPVQQPAAAATISLTPVIRAN